MNRIVIAFSLLLLFNWVDSAAEQVHLAFYKSHFDISVTWVTFQKEQSLLHFGTSLQNLQRKEGTYREWTTGNITRYSHTVILDNLQPSTKYYYEIGNRTFEFSTLEKDPKSFKVCVFGDLGVFNGRSIPSIINNTLAGKFDFIIHIGDIAYDLHSKNGTTGDKFMNLMEPAISRVPYMVIAGNHEDDNKNFTEYQMRYVMPDSGFRDNQFYSFNLGPVHWVGVSTEYYGFENKYGRGSIFTQYNWLTEDLKNANQNRSDAPWIVMYQHRPFYCSTKGSENCQRNETRLARKGLTNEFPGLEELYLEYSADLIFTGHVHAYERFWPVASNKYYPGNSSIYHNSVAPVYLLTGSAGCHTPGSKFSAQPMPWSVIRSNDYGYTIMTVANSSHIRLEQISLDENETSIDDYWIVKEEGHKHTRQKREALNGYDFYEQEEL